MVFFLRDLKGHAIRWRDFLVWESIDFGIWAGNLIVRNSHETAGIFDVLPILQLIVLHNRWLDLLRFSRNLNFSLFIRILEDIFIDFVTCIQIPIVRECQNILIFDKSLYSNIYLRYYTLDVFDRNSFDMRVLLMSIGFKKQSITLLH